MPPGEREVQCREDDADEIVGTVGTTHGGDGDLLGAGMITGPYPPPRDGGHELGGTLAHLEGHVDRRQDRVGVLVEACGGRHDIAGPRVRHGRPHTGPGPLDERRDHCRITGSLGAHKLSDGIGEVITRVRIRSVDDGGERVIAEGGEPAEGGAVDRQGVLERDVAGEHRDGHGGAGGIIEQRPTGLHDLREAAIVPAGAGEQREPFVESVDDVAQRQVSQLGRRELQCQRRTVEPITQHRNEFQVQGGAGACGSCTIDEECGRGIVGDGIESDRLLGGDAQRDPARHDHRGVVASVEQ